MDPAGGAAAGFGFSVFVIAMMTVGVGGMIFWIVALIEVAKTSDHAFRAAGTEKTTWLLIVGLVGWIGALIYWFGTRQQLMRIGALGPSAAAYGAPYQPATPPGWYQNPEADGLRWWDGHQWTDHVA